MIEEWKNLLLYEKLLVFDQGASTCLRNERAFPPGQQVYNKSQNLINEVRQVWGRGYFVLFCMLVCWLFFVLGFLVWCCLVVFGVRVIFCLFF